MKTYSTSQVAAATGIHPNTVRLYEAWGLLPKVPRTDGGYRIFTDFHIRQIQLARVAFQIEILQNGLRKKIITLVKASAQGEFDRALILAEEYMAQLRKERANAREAMDIVRELLNGPGTVDTVAMKRRDVSQHLGISMDTLRNWEMNGLLQVRRKSNGYRVYTGEDVQRLKIIRSLRCANYSLEAILRMLGALSRDPVVNIEAVLDTPNPDDPIISACDQLISSLAAAQTNAEIIMAMLNEMKIKF